MPLFLHLKKKIKIRPDFPDVVLFFMSVMSVFLGETSTVKILKS